MKENYKKEVSCPHCGAPLNLNSKIIKYDDFIFTACSYCGTGVVIGKDVNIKNIDYVKVTVPKEKVIILKDKGWRLRYAISLGIFAGVVIAIFSIIFMNAEKIFSNDILNVIVQIIPILLLSTLLSSLDRIFK